MIYFDPNGNDATIYLVNTAGYSREERKAIGGQVAANFYRFGVKNVSVIWTNHAYVRGGRNTVTGEVYKDDQTPKLMEVRKGALGEHSSNSHLFAVNASRVTDMTFPSKDASASKCIGVGNAVTHEAIHEINLKEVGVPFAGSTLIDNGTPHDSDPSSLFNLEGGGSFEKMPFISDPTKDILQDLFNAPGENEQGISLDVDFLHDKIE